jgi:hypothetical protein
MIQPQRQVTLDGRALGAHPVVGLDGEREMAVGEAQHQLFVVGPVLLDAVAGEVQLQVDGAVGEADLQARVRVAQGTGRAQVQRAVAHVLAAAQARRRVVEQRDRLFRRQGAPPVQSARQVVVAEVQHVARTRGRQHPEALLPGMSDLWHGGGISYVSGNGLRRQWSGRGRRRVEAVESCDSRSS